MARTVPASLVACWQFNDALDMDPKILYVQTCEYINDPSDRLYWPFYRNGGGGGIQFDDQGTTAGATATGTKWGMAQMIDMSVAGANYWRGRDYDSRSAVGGQGFGRPTDNRIQSYAMWVQPTYSGSPATACGFFGRGSASWGGGSYNSGQLYHDTDGKLKWLQWSESHGTLVGITESSSAWSPVAGTWYLLEVCYDYVNGNQYLFIDGTLVGTSTFVRTGLNSFQCEYVNIGSANGSSFGYTFSTQFYMQELVGYDGVWHTSSYTVDDRPFNERYMEDPHGMPFALKFARDLSVGRDHVRVPYGDGGWLFNDVGIDRTSPKFGAGALNAINPPYFPGVTYTDKAKEIVGAIGQHGTIEFWFRQNGVPTFADEQYIIYTRNDNGLDGGTSNANYIRIYQNTNGTVTVYMTHGGSTACANFTTASNPFTQGVWHHVELDFSIEGSGSTWDAWLFVDGVLVSSDTEASNGWTRGGGTERVIFGDNEVGNGSYGDFGLDEVCFYDEVLHTSGFTPPTEAYDFDPPPDTRLLAAVASRMTRDPKTGLYIGAGIQR